MSSRKRSHHNHPNQAATHPCHTIAQQVLSAILDQVEDIDRIGTKAHSTANEDNRVDCLLLTVGQPIDRSDDDDVNHNDNPNHDTNRNDPKHYKDVGLVNDSEDSWSCHCGHSGQCVCAATETVQPSKQSPAETCSLVNEINVNNQKWSAFSVNPTEIDRSAHHYYPVPDTDDSLDDESDTQNEHLFANDTKNLTDKYDNDEVTDRSERSVGNTNDSVVPQMPNRPKLDESDRHSSDDESSSSSDEEAQPMDQLDQLDQLDDYRIVRVSVTYLDDIIPPKFKKMPIKLGLNKNKRGLNIHHSNN